MNTSKNKLKSLMLVLFFSAATISTASARVCFLPDSTDCGEGDVVGSSNVDVPCQYSNCPAYNTNYQTCYTERIYNNGGVNVECKQVKCRLSKSKCEEQEADPNSSQCCNFDSASGCYYMGSCKLCNRDVYDSEKNLGEGYNCYPCKDKNGTFYNCTAKEKECKDINPDYTSKCADSQTAKEVEGIKDSKGNQCYTCKDKPIGCTYEYRQATTADSCGLTDLNTNYQCMSTINDCRCYNQLQKVSSVWVGGGGYVTPYNRISNKSATCVDEKGVTRYQTICQGTKKSSCNTSKNDFKPNGCVSDTYNNGFEVKGDEWGDCVKKEETCTYEYTHLTKDITRYTIGGLDGQTLRFGKNGNQCYTEGLKATITSTCAKYNGTYRCGGLDGPECTNPGGSCEVERTCRQHYNCEVGTKCWDILSANKSIEKGGMGYPSVVTIYNKISNTSASCTTLDDETKYETLCEGTLRSRCWKKFTLNGCESDSYSIYSVYDNTLLNVVGGKFGDCSCDTSDGLYETVGECEKANESQSLKCTMEGDCYLTCEAAGKYSTENACKTATKEYSAKCTKFNNCYEPEINGFLIKMDSGQKRNWICYDWTHSNSCSVSAYTYLRDIKYRSDIKDDDYPGDWAKTVKGQFGRSFDDSLQQFPAGTYYLCFGQSGSKQPNGSTCPMPDLGSLSLETHHTTDVPIRKGQQGLRTVSDAVCTKVKFVAGATYLVRYNFESTSVSCN